MNIRQLPLTLQLARLARLTILHSLHLLLFFRANRAIVSKPSRIAVLRFSAVGDFVIAIPALIKLRSAFPDAKIMLITAASSQRSVRDSTLHYNETSHASPWVNFVYPSQVDLVTWIGSFSLITLLRDYRPPVRDFDPDLTFILPQQDGGSLESLSKKMIFLRILGVTSPVFGWKSGMGPMFNKWLFEKGLLDHAVFAPLKAIHEALSPDNVPVVKFTLDIPQEDMAWSGSLRHSIRWEGKQIIAISPSSVQPHKKWPTEYFVQLCRELYQCTDACIAVIGTKESREAADTMIIHMRERAINLCGDTTIQKLAAWLKSCTLLVGNDGGAMHVAAAVGCQCVAIMPGIEYPGVIEPWGNRQWSVRHNIECAPCYSFTHCPLGHNRCITQVAVKDVVVKCLAAILESKDLQKTN